MEWAQVVVVLLFVCLGLFVVAALALIFMLVRLTMQIRSLMKSAHQAADNLSQAAATASGVAQLVGILKVFKTKVTNYMRTHRKR